MPRTIAERQWEAATDAAWLKRCDLKVSIRESDDGRAQITLKPRSWCTDAAWTALMEPGQSTSRIALKCTTAEWVEMLAQGGK